jgi:hypothetical protein
MSLVRTDVSEQSVAAIFGVEIIHKLETLTVTSGRTKVSEESVVSIFRVERIFELRITLAVTSTEDGGDMFLRNVASNMINTAPHPRRYRSSRAVLCGHEECHLLGCYAVRLL